MDRNISYCAAFTSSSSIITQVELCYTYSSTNSISSFHCKFSICTLAYIINKKLEIN